jgi:hypothetical protein
VIVKHVFEIGKERFEREVFALDKEGVVFLETEDLWRVQRGIGRSLILERKNSYSVTPEAFNFLLNISGFRAKEIAEFLNVDFENLLQWRKETRIPDPVWQLFRVFFIELFRFGEVRNEVFLTNAKKITSAPVKPYWNRF